MNYYIVPINSMLDNGVRVRSDSPASAVGRYLSYYPASDLVVYESNSPFASYNFYTNLRFVSFFPKNKLKKLYLS